MQVENRKKLLESVRFDKITERLERLLGNDLVDMIDPSIVTQKVANRVHHGIKTSEIDQLAAQICTSLVTVNPGFGILAGRIVIDNHQKNTSESFLEVIKILRKNVAKNGDLAPLISEELEEIAEKHRDELQSMLDFSRDHDLGFFGFKTLERAYLLKVEGRIVERPQHLFLRVAIGIHGDSLEEIRETYDFMSRRCYTHATPTLFHAGTPRPQMSSCFLLGTEDSVEGIFKTITDCARISKWAGGLGIHIANIRSDGAYIRKTGGNSDGILPMLKVYNDTARYINQSGKRPGSFAIYLEPWHADILEFLDAKKNHGQEEERARDLFYALWVPDLFMASVRDNKDWYLMSPDESPGLSDVWGEEFERLYDSYIEKGCFRKKIKARELWTAILSSQIETGTPYMLYKDACNRKSNQRNYGTIRSSNLCAEIIEYSDDKEYAVCNLASLCLPAILSNSVPRFLKDASNRIEVYSKSNCGFCTLAKLVLKRAGLFFKEILLDDDEKRKQFFKANKVKTVPQIIVQTPENVSHMVGGFSDLWKHLKPKIDYEKLIQMTKSVTRNLNKIINKNFYPVPETKTSNFRHRPIGIGVQGLADLFIKLRVPFDSLEAREVNRNIFETIYYAALTASWELAKEHGPYETFKGSPMSEGLFQFDLWDNEEDKTSWKSGRYDWGSLREKIMKDGIRNSLLVAIMPTASTSQIMGNNECCEPYTSNIYKRRTMAGEFTVVNQHLIADLVGLGVVG